MDALDEEALQKKLVNNIMEAQKQLHNVVEEQATKNRQSQRQAVSKEQLWLEKM